MKAPAAAPEVLSAVQDVKAVRAAIVASVTVSIVTGLIVMWSILADKSGV